jgi:hypothetical protein
MFFVKLPQSWNQEGADDSHIQAMERVSNRFFRQTQRVVSVKFYFSLAIDFGGKHTAPIYLLKEFTNPRHRFNHSVEWGFFRDTEQPGSWVDIVKLCA